MSERVIVSMTSYLGRISNVGKSIYLLLNFQTRKPDEIHLWLSVEEFTNKEKNLPADLLAMLNHDKVTLHRLPKNTYVHKRHEIFKYTTDEDCVFLIDDDVEKALVSDFREQREVSETKAQSCQDKQRGYGDCEDYAGNQSFS